MYIFQMEENADGIRHSFSFEERVTVVTLSVSLGSELNDCEQHQVCVC